MQTDDIEIIGDIANVEIIAVAIPFVVWTSFRKSTAKAAGES